jgi:hypothetical protein
MAGNCEHGNETSVSHKMLRNKFKDNGWNSQLEDRIKSLRVAVGVRDEMTAVPAHRLIST